MNEDDLPSPFYRRIDVGRRGWESVLDLPPIYNLDLFRIGQANQSDCTDYGAETWFNLGDSYIGFPWNEAGDLAQHHDDSLSPGRSASDKDVPRIFPGEGPKFGAVLPWIPNSPDDVESLCSLSSLSNYTYSVPTVAHERIELDALETFPTRTRPTLTQIIQDAQCLNYKNCSSNVEGEAEPRRLADLGLKEETLSVVGVESEADKVLRACQPGCEQRFARAADLEAHAKKFRHKPYQCSEVECRARFSRRDVRTRHQERHKRMVSYECTVPDCRKYRGQTAFRRKDHLVQHARKVHGSADHILHRKYCPHESCELSSSDCGFKGFNQERDYAAHLRTEHGEGTYACQVTKCGRTGRNGFARRRDLDIHIRRQHRALK